MSVVEAIQIHLRKATLNRTDGYQLPDAYLPILRGEDAKRGGGALTQHAILSHNTENVVTLVF